MLPQIIYILIPGTCNMLPFMEKMTLETCLKSRIWRWEDGWAQCHPKGSYKMKEGGSRIKGDMTVQTEIRVMHT